jgi:hypothetical protein
MNKLQRAGTAAILIGTVCGCIYIVRMPSAVSTDPVVTYETSYSPEASAEKNSAAVSAKKDTGEKTGAAESSETTGSDKAGKTSEAAKAADAADTAEKPGMVVITDNSAGAETGKAESYTLSGDAFSVSVSVSPNEGSSPKDIVSGSALKDSGTEVIKEAEKKTVNVSISGAGEFSTAGSVSYTKGMTAWDALKILCDKQGYEVQSSGSGALRYVRAINGLAEKEHGAMSGWMYRVNGVSPDKGAGSYKLEEGDHVSWYYQKDE